MLRKIVAISLFVFCSAYAFIFISALNGPVRDNGDPANLSMRHLDMGELSLHSTPSDCWLLIDGKVYDITPYIRSHPGGASMITMNCGKDASAAYSTKGGEGKDHSGGAKAMLDSYFIGKLGGEIDAVPTKSTADPASIVLERYPGAIIDEIEEEDEGTKIKIINQGNEIQVLVSGGAIVGER